MSDRVAKPPRSVAERRVLLFGGLLFCALCTGGGCNTLSALGLPGSSGSQQMLATTNRMRNAAGLPIDRPRELSKDVLSVYIVEPGDVLIIEPANFNSSVRLAGGDQTVKPDGTIDLGQYGRVLAAGQTLDAIQAEVQALVDAGVRKARAATGNGGEEADESGPILVRLASWESKVFYVMGEANSPGAYPYSGRETVLDAIVAAGDLNGRANRHKIVLSRPSRPGACREVLPVCYNQIVQLGDTSTNYQILPGDRVFIPSLSLTDDLLQSIFPQLYDKCPRCGTRQVPCHVALCGRSGESCDCLQCR